MGPRKKVKNIAALNGECLQGKSGVPKSEKISRMLERRLGTVGLERKKINSTWLKLYRGVESRNLKRFRGCSSEGSAQLVR